MGNSRKGIPIGVYLPALYDVTVKWWDIAAEFVKCRGNQPRLKDFYNLWLGLEWKDLSVAAPDGFDLRGRNALRLSGNRIRSPARRGLSRRWASRLLMAVDTQAESFYWIIRAFGPNFRSQRIDHGQVGSFEAAGGDRRPGVLSLRK